MGNQRQGNGRQPEMDLLFGARTITISLRGQCITLGPAESMELAKAMTRWLLDQVAIKCEPPRLHLPPHP